MQIRTETPADRQPIADLVTAAFTGAPHASGREAAIVDDLRQAGALELSLLAEDGDGIVGHVAGSRGRIGDGPGWLCLGPVAVRPDRQRAGIGSRLIRASIARAREAGAAGAALVGDPDYYGRFGFAADPGVTVPGVPDRYVLVLPFGAPPAGVLEFHPAFSIDYA